MAKQQNDEFFTDAEEFFASDHPVELVVACPELRRNEDDPVKKIRVRSMSGPDKVALDAKRWDPTKAVGDPDRFRARWFEEERPYELVAACCIRPDGSRLFTAADAKRLKGVNPKTFARLLAAAQEANGDDANELRLSGKAGGRLSGDSGSESPTATATEASLVSSTA